MGTPYAGADSYPTDFVIPDDGDNEDASSVNVALEALGDRTTNLHNHSPRMASLEVTASGTWTVPDRVTKAQIIGSGGGGGGGGGGTVGSGGGGGGGAKVSIAHVTLTPGDVITITIGTGGAGGAGGVGAGAAADGADGANSTFGALATFYGAMGGEHGQINGTPHQALGGMPSKSVSARGTAFATAPHRIPTPGEGGLGTNINDATFKAIEMSGGSTAAGLGGLGTVPATVTYGGSGGGGGASEVPGNVAGAGGTDPGGAGPRVPGGAGTRGAGGGGGGPGPAAGGDSGTGGAGGAGGDGVITINWVVET